MKKWAGLIKSKLSEWHIQYGKNGCYRRKVMKTIPVEQSGWNTNKGCYSSPIQEEDYVWVQMKLRDFKMLKQIKEKEIKKGKLKR